MWSSVMIQTDIGNVQKWNEKHMTWREDVWTHERHPLVKTARPLWGANCVFLFLSNKGYSHVFKLLGKMSDSTVALANFSTSRNSSHSIEIYVVDVQSNLS